MVDQKDEPRYPIRVVSKRSGLSSHVIRVWERRYGAVEPTRTATNRRLYSENDIERFRLLHRATAAGHAISSIATCTRQELLDLLDTTEPSLLTSLSGPDAVADISGEAHLKACKEAVRRLDLRQLEACLLECQRQSSTTQLLNNVVAPLLEWTGAEWSAGRITVAEEHALSAVLRQFLGNVRSSLAIPKGGPLILLTTPAGQNHEFGALMASVVAASEGWQELYLGPNLPAQDIARAAELRGATAVGLSIVHPPDDPHLSEELRLIRRLLPPAITIMAGGRSAANYLDILEALEIWHVPNLPVFREQLRVLREMRASALG